MNAGLGVRQEVAEGGGVGAADGIEVVDEWEDFGVFVGVCDGAGDFVLAVDGVGAILIDDVVGVVVDGVGVDGAVGVDEVEPLGEEEVDLLDVLLEGGVAGGVPLDVVGGAQAFVCIQGDVGGFEVGLAMGRAGLLSRLQGRGRLDWRCGCGGFCTLGRRPTTRGCMGSLRAICWSTMCLGGRILSRAWS